MRLIDADALYIEIMDRGIDGLQLDDLSEIQQVIADAPAADVAPVRRGKWTDEPLGLYCSECGHPIDFHEKTPFCPMCGAKME